MTQFDRFSCLVFRITPDDKIEQLMMTERNMEPVELFGNGPLLGLVINSASTPEAVSEGANEDVAGLLAPENRILFFFSWDRQEVVSRGMQAPRNIYWSGDAAFAALAYESHFCLYDVAAGFRLVR